MELASRIAELQFLNRDFFFVFRGQPSDYKNRSGYTTLKPNILRSSSPKKTPSVNRLNSRFSQLDHAEKSLVRLSEQHGLVGRERIRRQRLIRWAILQHYEVCKTPLLDVTQSLRIAASFASLQKNGEGVVFVLGIPNIGGAVAASAEAGLQIIRLASVCPPSAIRPHIQEGYLLGEYPDLSSVGQKNHYQFADLDFGRRLIAKFQFSPSSFWRESKHFPNVGESALYPDAERDEMVEIAEEIKLLICK